MKPKFNWSKCDRPIKEMFHGICLQKCCFNVKCSYDNKKCKAYIGKLK
jgi:hypothetical protein